VRTGKTQKTTKKTNEMFARIIASLFLLSVGLIRAERPDTSVVVFAKGEAGYYCHKIPYLFRTQSGSLIALAEGRGKDGRTTCDDFSVS
jgi:hypothetical protein